MVRLLAKTLLPSLMCTLMLAEIWYSERMESISTPKRLKNACPSALRPNVISIRADLLADWPPQKKQS